MSIGRIMRLRRQAPPLPVDPPAPLFFDDTPPACSPELALQLMKLILDRKAKERRVWNLPLGSFLPTSR